MAGTRRSRSAFFPVMALLLLLVVPGRPAFADNITLAWDPNTESDLAGYKVYYGTSSRNYTTVLDAGNVATFTVTGLGPGVYYFAVTAYNTSGEESPFSNEVSTAIGGIAPVISSVAATGVTSSAAVILWATNIACDSQVEYGTSTSYGYSTTLDPNLLIAHSQSLSSLAAGTLYHYRVKSKDGAGDQAISDDHTFTTSTAADTAPPTVAITSPTSNPIYTTTSGVLSVGGTAADNTGVTQVTWSSNRGGSGAASGTTSWSASGITLQSGANVITVTARDAAGNSGSAILTVTFTPPSLADLTVTIISPTTNATYTTSSNPISLSGTASGPVAITRVTWANDRGGGSVATGTTNWSVDVIILQKGTNVLTVTAFDAAGKTDTARLTISYIPPDTTIPRVTITSPTSGPAYSTGLSVVNLNGTAVDIVGITQVTWTNDRGGAGTAAGAENWSVTGVALKSGANVITVTALDLSGNPGTATLTVTYTSTDVTPPAISGVLVRTIATGAVISWTTNEPADSQIEYGTTSAYGKSTALDPLLVTSHVQSVSGLTADTGYHFRIRSKDEAGNLAISADFTLKTAASGSDVRLSLFYPAISSPHVEGHAAQSDAEYTAVALSNQDSLDAILSFTAYDTSGAPVSGEGITNPVTKNLRPGEQMPVIDVQLFGDGILSATPLGWIEVDSTTQKLAGFFMTFDSQLTLLDGAEISSGLLTSLVLPEIADKDFTKIQLANPSKDAASVKLSLLKADGGLRGTAEQTIGGNGTLAADLFADIFKGVAPEPSDYLRVFSSRSLLSYETLGRVSKDIAILAGQDYSKGASLLYSPQYAVGGPWRTTLSIINLDSIPGTVTLRLFTDSGSQIGSTRFMNIAGGGKLYIQDPSFFSDSVLNNPEQVVQGYLEISAIGLRLAGSVVFGDAKQGIFSAALPLVSTLPKSVIFSHIASDDIYFTGLAMLNPNENQARATIDLYSSDGKLEASVTQTIPARWRKSSLLTEYFPSLEGQSRTSGYFKVTVDQGVACFALFGTHSLSVLSAIPAQPAP